MSFAAKYPGKCGECGRRFQAGEEVEFRYNDWSEREIVALHDHSDSALLDEIGKKPSEVCPRCFLVHKGECL